MRHRSKKKTLDRKKAPREALLKNLICQVILYEKIQTTEAKAKAVKPLVEKIITRGKTDNLANRRMLIAKLPIKKAVRKVFEVLGPKYKDRQGGYLRIIKIGTRHGDGAEMSQIEFV
ncbi:MAG TPA: 50S ribosomal protein L17 [Patescibacteria group bacterium]|nr:50S ribosomal protein L17 [Patescibacteria group bacterium]